MFETKNNREKTIWISIYTNKIVNEMLDKLPEKVWLNKNLK